MGAARGVEVQAGENRWQLVAVLVGLAPLLTRASVEFHLTRQAAQEDDNIKQSPIVFPDI